MSLTTANTNIKILSQPEFLVPLTRELVDFLIGRAKNHYDFKCQGLASTTQDSRVNGLLTIWGMHLDMADEGEPVFGSASYNELSLIIKTLEMVHDLEGDKLDEAMRLSQTFTYALKTADEVSLGWHTTVTMG